MHMSAVVLQHIYFHLFVMEESTQRKPKKGKKLWRRKRAEEMKKKGEGGKSFLKVIEYSQRLGRFDNLYKLPHI